MTSSTAPRLFHLERDTDVTGVSGTGRVADGVQWPDGTVALRWIGDRPSTTVWGSVDDVAAIHGHGGATRIVWAEEQPDRAAILEEAAAHAWTFSQTRASTDDDLGMASEIEAELRRMAARARQDGAQQ
ncbi:hypothetical protein ACIRPR_06425 [Streptomyces griseoflavus]|uniref:hypothetical protein n=1 Tax=Streptomyces griseoflavus TaxID=35619 RepID=UPI0038161A06